MATTLYCKSVKNINLLLTVKIIVIMGFFCGSFSSIQALLSAPNPDDPLSENIAKHWKSNEAEAVETGMSFLLV